MTLHEIEETLHTLKDRHAGLDESQLLTLLRAGGWEEKSIQEAITLFRSSGRTNGTGEEKRDDLPRLQENPVFVPPIEIDHMLPEGRVEEKDKEAPSPESIIVSDPRIIPKRDELPHNLPLRPFETSEHIWPFSRYRDVFYGEGEQPVTAVQRPEAIPGSPPVVPAPVPEQRAFVQPEPVMTARAPAEEVKLPPPQVVQVHVVKAPLSKGDEKLVIMASVMLVIILLLLGYMYGNGRL